MRAAALSPKIESILETGRILNSSIDNSASVILELKPLGSHFKIQVVLEGQN